MKDQLPDLKNPLPMPAVKSPKTEAISTNEIEKTKRALYACLDRIRRAGKHRKLTAEFEERLEEHLEQLRTELLRWKNSDKKSAEAAQFKQAEQKREREQHEDVERRLHLMTEERDQIQQRLHAIDHAYNEQSNRVSIMDKMIDNLQVANKAAGEELIRAQSMARQYGEDCRSAEKHSDDFSEKLRDAQAVIGHQEQLIVGQRLAIADLYLAGRRVNSAVATLQRLGYTDCGGQLWKPPIGKKPDFVDYGAELREQNNGQPSR